jgi:hypothetical protein
VADDFSLLDSPMLTSASVARLETAAVFSFAAFVYIASPVHVQADSQWSIPTAISILREGNIDLDEYQAAYERIPHGTIRVGQHVYPWYPLAVSLVALPVVAVMEGCARAGLAVLPHPPGWLAVWDTRFHAEGDIQIGYYARTEGVIASLCAALAVALYWAAARRRLELVPALVLTALLAFGTGLWSTASRVLWQHGPSAAVLAWVVWLLTGDGVGRRWQLQLGVAAGLAYVLRPTNSLTAFGLFVYVGLWRPRALPGFVLGAALVAVPFCALNLSLYQALLPDYFRPHTLGASSRPWPVTSSVRPEDCSFGRPSPWWRWEVRSGGFCVVVSGQPSRGCLPWCACTGSPFLCFLSGGPAIRLGRASSPNSRPTSSGSSSNPRERLGSAGTKAIRRAWRCFWESGFGAYSSMGAAPSFRPSTIGTTGLPTWTWHPRACGIGATCSRCAACRQSRPQALPGE